MRTFGCGIAALLLLAPGTGYTSPRLELNLSRYDTTDVVVTDADGVVLECWRGDFRPGEVVRLGPGRLPLAHALPWELLRLRPDRSLSRFYRNTDDLRRAWGENWAVRSWGWNWDPLPPSPSLPMYFWPTATDGAEADLRLVLFLRRERVAGLPTIWIPTASPRPQKFTTATYVPEEPTAVYGSRDYTNHVVMVEGGRVVNPHPDEVAATTLAEFKTVAMLRTQSIPTYGAKFDGAVRRYAAFGPLAALPPLTGP